jgi:hypothetical protein
MTRQWSVHPLPDIAIRCISSSRRRYFADMEDRYGSCIPPVRSSAVPADTDVYRLFCTGTGAGTTPVVDKYGDRYRNRYRGRYGHRIHIGISFF